MGSGSAAGPFDVFNGSSSAAAAMETDALAQGISQLAVSSSSAAERMDVHQGAEGRQERVETDSFGSASASSESADEDDEGFSDAPNPIRYAGRGTTWDALVGSPKLQPLKTNFGYKGTPKLPG